MKKYVLLFCLAGFAFGETSLELDPAKTEINFTLHDPLHTVHGNFKLKRGTVHFDPETGKAGGEIVIDVASGQSGNGSRDKRMQKEVLESQKYPEALFVIDSVKGRLESEGESTLDMHGLFKIHGADHAMTLTFLVDAVGGGHYNATSHFDIPYVAWGMKDPSNFLLKVDKKVEIEVKAAAGPRIEAAR
ncbi:MAG TPA: YceI family protein [Bryobacteraceae bacterium]|nr:YceI family protein [Bryobacteraceae bacterium]